MDQARLAQAADKRASTSKHSCEVMREVADLAGAGNEKTTIKLRFRIPSEE